MLLTKAYYLLKPLMPFSWRMELRRRRGNYRRRTYEKVWPIDEAAGATPPGWPGWPDGKRFAFVLSHDVEGAKGIDRVPRLMNLEREHGFTSSFNFVPQGEYVLSAALRDQLQSVGFEVGVHGLDHDGKLYSSKASFAAQAAKIRQYLRGLECRGVPLAVHAARSCRGFTSWVQSTTLPHLTPTLFEPQPDGRRNDFSLLGRGSAGFRGMSSFRTLWFRDFNLFVVLQEPNIDIWRAQARLDRRARRHGPAK